MIVIIYVNKAMEVSACKDSIHDQIHFYDLIFHNTTNTRDMRITANQRL